MFCGITLFEFVDFFYVTDPVVPAGRVVVSPRVPLDVAVAEPAARCLAAPAGRIRSWRSPGHDGVLPGVIGGGSGRDETASILRCG